MRLVRRHIKRVGHGFNCAREPHALVTLGLGVNAHNCPRDEVGARIRVACLERGGLEIRIDGDEPRPEWHWLSKSAVSDP